MDNKDKLFFLIGLKDDIEINIAYNAVIDHRKKYEDKSLTELDIAPKTIHVEENLALYKNSSSPFFWCRFRVNGLTSYVRKSTKNKKAIEASAEAKLIKYKITEQVKAGTYYEKDLITWRKVCLEVIKDLSGKAEKAKASGKNKPSSQGYLSIVQTYYLTIEQWRDIDIKSFNYADLNQLKNLVNFKDMPKTTATKRKTALKEIFEFALLNRYIDIKPELPTFAFIGGGEGIPFSIDDREVILSNFINFLESSNANYITQHKRTILPLYVNFLILTGVRPGEEAMNITWGHIEKRKTIDTDEFFYSLEVTKGKRSKRVKRDKKIIHTSREVIIDSATISTLERLYFIMNGTKKSIDLIIKERSSKEIFIGNTQAELEMGSTFSQYMEYLKTKIKHKYTLYSCRHEHINICLEKGKDIDDIAAQCGTSIATIDAHYKKFRHEIRAVRILGQDELNKLNPAPEQNILNNK
tara:strand:- start:3547 stop:4950 length:1404 start_codon:yes stop_codon:yes gene_type:complete